MLSFRTFLSCVLVTFAAILVGIAVATSSTFTDCIRQNEQNKSSAQIKEGAPEFLITFRSRAPITWRCTGKFIDENSPAITAFGTLVIAAFTIVLGVFTVSVARSTRIAAESTVGAESPRVRLSNLKFGRFGGNIRDHRKLPIITVAFKNYGRTVAVVTRVRLCVAVIGTLPAKPNYSDGYVFVPVGQAIEPDGEYAPQPKWFIDFEKFAAEQGSPMAVAGFPFRANLWVYGYIAYLDHLDRERTHGFAGCWMPPDTANPTHDASGESFLLGGTKYYAYDA